MNAYLVVILDHIYIWFSFVAQYGGGLLENVLGSTADKFGLTVDAFVNLICSLCAVPLAALVRIIPAGSFGLHMYNFIFGLLFSVLIFGAETAHAVGSAIIVYLILRLFPRRYSHVLVYIFAFTYLVAAHTYRMYVDYLGWKMDFTGPQMLLTQKFTSLAVDFHDAGMSTADDDNKLRLKKLPAVHKYLGYVFYFPGYLAGPTFEYRIYDEYSTQSHTSRRRAGNTMVNALAPMLRLFLRGVFFAAIFLIGGKMFPVSTLREDSFYTDTTFGYRFFIFWITASTWRIKYFFGWSIAEMAIVSSGIGFNGSIDEGNKKKEKKELKWDRIVTVFPLGIEFAQNWQMVARSWNHYTHLWLKKCVYMRWSKQKSSFVPTLFTFLTSAFWHGFYPAYYVAFICGAIIEQAARRVRRVVRPWILKWDKEHVKISIFIFSVPIKLAYDVIGIVTSVLLFDYCVISFQILRLDYSIKALQSLYFLGTIIPIIGIILLSFVPRVPVNVEKEKEKKTIDIDQDEEGEDEAESISLRLRSSSRITRSGVKTPRRQLSQLK